MQSTSQSSWFSILSLEIQSFSLEFSFWNLSWLETLDKDQEAKPEESRPMSIFVIIPEILCKTLLGLYIIDIYAEKLKIQRRKLCKSHYYYFGF